MQIEIPEQKLNECINTQIRSVVLSEINNLRKNNPYYITNIIEACVISEVRNFVNNDFIKNKASELIKEKIAKDIVEHISEKIENALCE